MQITEIVIRLQLFENRLSPNKLTSELEEQKYELVLPCSIVARVRETNILTKTVRTQRLVAPRV